jgi:hypothetical protein
LVNVTAGILSIVATASRLTGRGLPTTAYGRSIPADAPVFFLSGEVGGEDLGPLALRGPASQ